MSKLADAIKVVLAEEGAAVGRTKLVKLLFLADLEATRRGLPPVTDGRWRFDNFGPFSWAPIDEAEALARANEIGRVYWEDPFGGYSGTDYTAPAGVPLRGDLSEAQQEVVRQVVGQWRRTNAQQLKDHVYQLSLIRGHERGEVFDMTTDSWREELEFHDLLDDVTADDGRILGELTARCGDSTPHH